MPERCEHCDEHDMVPGALAQRFKDERNQARAEVERLREGIAQKNKIIVRLNRRVYELEHPALCSRAPHEEAR
jgi:hypothetical protein